MRKDAIYTTVAVAKVVPVSGGQPARVPEIYTVPAEREITMPKAALQ
jgi:hypothetical protein